jgi:hypothetical protein
MMTPADLGIAAGRRDAAMQDRWEIPMVQIEPDYKTARFAEWCITPRGIELVRTCADLVGGRWEYFVSIEARFDVQAEVL